MPKNDKENSNVANKIRPKIPGCGLVFDFYLHDYLKVESFRQIILQPLLRLFGCVKVCYSSRTCNNSARE